jgi:hypothetical protein
MKKILVILSMILCVSATKVSAQTTTQTKRGWSQPKKGAVIGAAAGAATGAIVSKRRGRGAVIGGAAGAGAGYLYGKHRQKKHPKVVRKTKVVTR